MASVREIARKEGVSISTVSRVLNNSPHVRPEVRDQVLAALNRSRYVPKSSRRGATNIAFVYTGESSIGSPFDAALLAGISETMDTAEHDLVILDGRRALGRGETYPGMFMRKGIGGVILRANSESRAVCQQIAKSGFPCVVVGERFEGADVPFVVSDSRAVSKEAVEHLISLGHRNIAICTNIVLDSDHADRLAGYQDALKAHDLPIDESMIWRIPAWRASGAQVIKRILTLSPRPTAVYIADPLTSVGAMTAARTAGIRIPDDLSIIGFDDSEFRHFVSPSMTAVCQDAVGVGREAGKVLDSLLLGRPVTRQKLLSCWLELHETTGKPAR